MSPLRSVFTRPGPGGGLYYPCKNEPARFDAEGNVIADPLMMGNVVVAYQEGWVEVQPYWAPTTTIRVCALDAQERASSVVCPGPAERYPFVDPFCQQLKAYADATQTPFTGAETSCDGPLSIFAPGCGCGPNLELCQTQETLATLRSSLLEQEMRLIDKNVSTGRPYHEILTQMNVEMNAPLALYLQKQSKLNFDLYADLDMSAPIPSG